MKRRITKPEKGNKFYNTIENGGLSTCIVGNPVDEDCNVLSNCVGYACGRFNEILGEMKYPSLNCNAENFIERALENNLEIIDIPSLGGIMVWQKGKTLNDEDGAGHVAIVEEIIDENNILTSESGYLKDAFWTQERNNDGKWGQEKEYSFRGCIVNPKLGKIILSSSLDDINK